MLNEKRVKQMVKLAMYEGRAGVKELPISEKRKQPYLFINTMWTIMWLTIAFVLFIIFIGIGLKSFLISDLTTYEIALVGVLVLGLYIGLLFFGVPRARRFYRKQHAQAHKNVKQFKKDLAELERMYQEEDKHGEDI